MFSSQNSLSLSLAEPLEDYGLSDLSLEHELVRFKNEDGYVRLGLVRENLDLGSAADLDLLTRVYPEWVLDDLGILMKKTRKSWTASSDWSTKETFEFTKARKRGNDMDAFRIDRRMRNIRDNLMPYCQSSDPEKSLRTTRLVYVTLTDDQTTLMDGNRELAWRTLGPRFNNFKSRLAKTFGTTLAEVKNGEFVESQHPCKIHVIRSWESHESGMPHVHALMAFEDFNFKMFQDDKFRWRIKYKDRFEDAWPYGFVDVLAITPGTLEKELTNVLWYVTKNLSDMDYRLVRSWPRKRLLTQSILWFLGARSFSVSRSLTKSPGDDLIKPTSIIQNQLDGEGFETELVSWEFLGLIHRKHTELHRDDWEMEYSEPPPWLDRCWKPYSGRFGSGWASSWLSGGS